MSVLREAERDRTPLIITQFNINPILLHLSVHLSHTLSVSCDESQITLAPVQLVHLFSNWVELSQALATHYSLSLLSQAGWIIGSLDLIGNPVLLLNKVRSGLHDLIALPYEGLTRGPGFFVLGLGQGMTSLLSSISGGVLQSVTNFASGLAANIERLSLDPDHIDYQEMLRQRGQRSEYVGAGLLAGVSSFGMSVMSAVAGVVEQPFQSVQQVEEETVTGYTKSIMVGVGKGLLGIVTKPVGGALQLVSQTGQGIISAVGFNSQPQLRRTLIEKWCGRLNKADSQPSVNKFRK